MSPEYTKLFEAYGFEKVTNRLWWFGRTYEIQDSTDNDEPNTKAVVVIEVVPDGRFVGYVPMVQDPVYRDGLKRVPERGLVFVTADARDLIALAQNEVASAGLQATGHNSEIGFTNKDEDMLISLPFCDEQYGDYATTSRGGRYVILADPSETHGSGYTEWRNDFCDRLANGTAPKP